MTFSLELMGHVPSKKNNWRPRAQGGIGVRRDVQGYIDALIAQARLQWRGNAPCVSPDMDVKFYVRDWRGDRDNKLTTILDVLKRAGVIADDNTKQFNGTLMLLPSIIDRDEKTVLTLTLGPRPKKAQVTGA